MVFRINNNKWEIVFIRSNHPILEVSSGVFTLGVCNNSNKTIFLSENLYGGMLKKVLIHEVAHAFMFEYHIDLLLEEEERICDIISTHGCDIVSVSSSIFENMRKNRRVF